MRKDSHHYEREPGTAGAGSVVVESGDDTGGVHADDCNSEGFATAKAELGTCGNGGDAYDGISASFGAEPPTAEESNNNDSELMDENVVGIIRGDLLLNADSSSLPSVLTDPGQYCGGGGRDANDREGADYNGSEDGGLTEGCYYGSAEAMTRYGAPKPPDNYYGSNTTQDRINGSHAAADNTTFSRQQQQRRRGRARRSGTAAGDGTAARQRASSTKRAVKKRQQRTHSETDLRKMRERITSSMSSLYSRRMEEHKYQNAKRPFIASPFMPTLATQVSVDGAVPSTSQEKDARRRPLASSVNSTTNNNVKSTGDSKSALTQNDASMVGVIPSVGQVKLVVGNSKYNSLPLKKPPESVANGGTDTKTSLADGKAVEESEDDESSSCSPEDESSSSSSGSSSESSEYTRFSDLTRRQWATVAMLAVANLCSTIAFSCIAPFYPGEANKKGMNASEIGLVFGIFELVMFFSAPILGKYMAFFGSKRMFTVGLLITGVTAIMFGFLNFLPASSLFFWASLTIRITEALGDVCFVTSSFAISAKCFPGRIATIVGIMETFAGLGYTAGPVIGGVLYEYGGFQLPFLTLGILLLIATGFSYFLIEEIEDERSEDAKGMLSMLKIPVIWLMVFAVVICAISLSFFDPTLADHLSSFKLSTAMVGLMFLLCGGIYTLTAPLWGLLLDRWHCCNSLMLFGSTVTVISMILVGPSPLFMIEKNLFIIGVALSLLGLAAGALYIPTFQNCLDAVKEHGFDDSFQTYGCVSGVFQSAFAFGAFLGPTVGGFSVEIIGFPWTTTIIAGINLCFILTLLVFFVCKRCYKYRALNSSESDDDENDEKSVAGMLP